MAIERLDEMPDCPNCGDSDFQLGSLFAAATMVRRDDLGGGVPTTPEWLEEAREGVSVGSGPRIAYRDEEAVHVLPLKAACSRIGRSPVADIRLEDPTVSRRHALLARDGDDLRVYNDRSLNGIFVNGEIVEDAELTDGDELVIGRFHLFVIAA